MIRVASSALVLALLAWGRPAAATVADTTALEFRGFRAGARLEELDRLVRSSAGGRLRCRHAKADRHVMECRATVSDPELGRSLELWVSAMDSSDPGMLEDLVLTAVNRALTQARDLMAQEMSQSMFGGKLPGMF